MTIDEKKLRELADDICADDDVPGHDALIDYIRANTPALTKPKLEPCPVCGQQACTASLSILDTVWCSASGCGYVVGSLDAHNQLSREHQFVAAVLNHRSVNPVWVNDLLREKGLLP